MKSSTHMRPGRRSIRLFVGSVLRVGVLALAVSIFATVPTWAAKYTMVIAHLYSEDLTVDEVAPSLARFKQLVESGTGGDIEVKIFDAAALGRGAHRPGDRPRRRPVQRAGHPQGLQAL